MSEGILVKVKDFFGYTSMKEFGDDWKALSNDEKEYFKSAVEAELQARETTPTVTN